VLEARDAFRKGQDRAVRNALERVQGHPLEPLVAYWDARLGLEQLPTERIRAFLDRWAGTYYEDRLRNDWLRLLGARRDWALFLAEWPQFRMADDPQVRCHGLHARLATQGPLTPAEATEAANLWLAQKEPEDACTALVERLLDTRQLPAATVWQRARVAAEFNRPAVANQAVSLLNPEWTPTLAKVLEQPARYLDDKLTAVRPRTREIVTLALIRLAATDPDEARAQLERARWQVQLTQEEKSWVWGVVGKTAAQRLQPDAAAWFARGRPEHMHPDHLAWWARAALRSGQWAQVSKAIAAMPKAQQDDPAWTYWHARAWLALRVPDAPLLARAAFQRVADPHHFYGQLALEALDQPIAPPPRPAPLTAAELQRAQQDPGLARALKAIEIGLRAEGVREWNYTTNLHTPGGMSDRERLAAADWACRQRVWDRCINTSDRTDGLADHTQRYPMPHRDAVVGRSEAIGLDPAYVYGLIRQESRFITDARSHVGASGLMQVMPATAKWTARKIGLTGFRPEDINDRDTNIAIGTGYLKLVLDDFDGSMPLAAAAYNAGPSRARQWRAPGGSGPVLEGAIWAENIPFAETRDYVKKVLANATVYAAVLTGRPQSLLERLGTVGPRAPRDAPPDTDLP
jgi:soluble lytic murein transglycosylase